MPAKKAPGPVCFFCKRRLAKGQGVKFRLCPSLPGKLPAGVRRYTQIHKACAREIMSVCDPCRELNEKRIK